MVQASNEQSRETYVEARGSVKYYHTNEEQTSKGWFWCHEKQGFFRHSDWHLTRKEMGEKYEN
jgi:hypothetical protein